MVYLVCVDNPLATEFYRELGASDFHFGLLGGLPIITLCLQFFGALMSNMLRRRKPLFMSLIIAGRLLYVPLSLLPLFFPETSGNVLLAYMIFLVGMSSALANATGPLFFSWMADLIPKKMLNRYWGVRQGWLHFFWASSFIVVIIYSYAVDLPTRISYPLIAIPGVVAGVVDILFFIGAREPQNTIVSDTPIMDVFLEPLRHKEYRSFLIYSCFFAASTMCAAAFMQIYVLKEMRLPVWQTSLIWSMLGFAAWLSSKKWGMMADRFGQKPIIVFCTVLKPVVVLVFVFLTPTNTLWLLPGFFVIDNLWNSGIMISCNGYMLKISPKRNRSMFIASMVALSGVSGGLAAIAAGLFLDLIPEVNYLFCGIPWTNYRILFMLSFFFRVGCIFLALRIKEPSSSSTLSVLNDIRGSWPWRVIRFPVGLYKNK